MLLATLVGLAWIERHDSNKPMKTSTGLPVGRLLLLSLADDGRRSWRGNGGQAVGMVRRGKEPLWSDVFHMWMCK